MTEKTISTTEARKNISKIMDDVETGKANYTVVRNQRVVARIVAKDFEQQNSISPNFGAELKNIPADQKSCYT